MATSFDGYINRYTSTEIPLIQRDYVQGANFWSGKRNAFLASLLTALHSGNSKTINFIYGTSGGNKHFIPLDGQQRLTSLNLLGWALYQAVKLTSPDDIDPSWGDRLRLSYQTRASSQEFCAKLLESTLSNLDEKPSEQIKGRLWFAESWRYDPTIRAMLEMLDYIWEQLKTYQEDLPLMAKRFFTASPIDFELLELNNRDPDDLYIKINARGKPLTEFEHWKAWFIGKLGTNAPDFECNIETVWCDYFWQFAKNNVGHVKYPRIDEYFMRFFAFITDILGVISAIEGKSYSECLEKDDNAGARKVTEKVYFPTTGEDDNLKLLFTLLDTLPKIGDLSCYLFSAQKPNDTLIATEKQKVNVFGTAKDLDLLSFLLKGDNLDLPLKLLLWGIIRYVSCHGKAQLQDFIRVWWGIIMNIRQRLAKGFNVTFDLELSDFAKWNDVLETILKDADPFANTDKLPSRSIASWLNYNSTAFHTNNRARYNEDIVRLQNHPWLLYDVHVLNNLIVDSAISPGYIFDRFFNQFVNLQSNTQGKELLNHGFKGCKPKNGYLTYGLTDSWAYILTDDASPAAAPLCALLRGDAPFPTTHWPSDFILKYYDILKYMPENSAFHVDTQKGELFGAKKSLWKQGYIMEPYNYVTAIRAGYTMQDGNAAVTYGTSGCKDEISLFTVDSTHWGICFPSYKIQMEPLKDGWWLKSYDDGADPNVKKLTAAFTARFGSPSAWKDSQGVFNINPDGFVANISGKDTVETGEMLLKSIIQLL